jgi:arylsulfatase A-like enzyme
MSTTRPNVLWICTDQQRHDSLGCYGNGFVDTGHVDRVAAEGTRFERCYSQSPVCTPSRASMLTGRYPRTTGCRQNGQALPDDETLVTRRLADAGYRCGLSGKLHLAPCHPDALDPETGVEDRVDDGYTEFSWSHHPTHDSPANEYLDWVRERDVDLESDTYVDESTGAVRVDRSHRFESEPYANSEYVQISLPAEHHQSTWCTERALEFLDRHAGTDSPWLFSVNYFDPHHAFDPPKEYIDRYLDVLEDLPAPDYAEDELADRPEFQRQDRHGAYNNPGYYPAAEMSDRDHRLVRAAYWAMVDLIDDQVGRLLDALEAHGVREDTVVIFTSDHGEMLGDRGLYLKGPYFYEPAVRVPLVVSWPGRFRQGRVVDSLVELTDLAPTLLEAAGLGQPEAVQGRSLYPLLTGAAPADRHRSAVYCEYYNATKNYDDYEQPPYGTMVRTEQYKLVRWHGRDTGELYDLSREPGETENLWNDEEYAEVRTRLLGRLSDRMAETIDPLPERTVNW